MVDLKRVPTLHSTSLSLNIAAKHPKMQAKGLRAMQQAETACKVYARIKGKITSFCLC